MKHLALFLIFGFLVSPSLAGSKESKIVIPVSQDKSEVGSWELLKYKKIKPNEVKFTPKGIHFVIAKSASPSIFHLKKSGSFKEARLKFDIKSGELKLKKTKQGAKGNDDSLLRFGVVYQGKRRLNFFQRSVAAPWVLKLFSLAPKGIGVAGVEFFNVVSDASMQGVKRSHPSSDLLKENFVIKAKQVGKEVMIPLNKDKKVLALWMSSDGDDTGSSFEVLISKIELLK